MRKIFIFIFLYVLTFANNLTDFSLLDEKKHISKDIYKKLSIIETDQTLLCNKDRYKIDQIRDLIFKYSFEKNDYFLNQLDSLIKESFTRYFNDINFGCLQNNDFVKKNEFKQDKNIQNHFLYISLKKALNRYIDIKRSGGWEKIDKSFFILKKGDKDPEIIKIKKRLQITDDYSCADFNEIFDECLEDAVKRFQKRHGIKIDGVIGPNTLKMLNISVDKKIEIIKLNIERLRWLLDEDEDFILVNIPDFSLLFYKNNKLKLKMKAIVGKKERQSPLMSDFITYAVLNPYWKAPETIVKEDILPKLKNKEFDYLKKKGIIATLDWDGNEEIDFEDIDWNQYNYKNVPFVFMQKPGPKNFLGFVKFIFPNSEDIYIHDTPDQYLFNYRKRAFSSGCIRVHKPIELFYYLYNNKSEKITYRGILEKLLTKKTQILPFDKKIRIYIMYLTSFVDEDGVVNFREDIYDIDKKMKNYLKNLVK